MQYIFYGRLLPERVSITINDINLIIKTHEEPMDGKLRITICDSQIILLYDTEVIIDNIYSLKNYLEVLTRSQVDADRKSVV